MKLFELYNRQPLRETRTLRASIKLCESVVKLLEAGDFEYTPDPAFAGVKGVTRDTGAGVKDRKAAQQKQQQGKLNQTWVTLTQKLKGIQDPKAAQVLRNNMKKVADAARKRGFALSPSPDQVLGL